MSHVTHLGVELIVSPIINRKQKYNVVSTTTDSNSLPVRAGATLVQVDWIVI